MSGVTLALVPAAAAVGLLVVAGLVGLGSRGGRVRLVGPVAASIENIDAEAVPGRLQVRWIFLASLAAGALLYRAAAGAPALELGLPTPPRALLLLGGGVMVGLGLRLVEGPRPDCGGVGPRSAALAAATAVGAGLATAVLSELLLR